MTGKHLPRQPQPAAANLSSRPLPHAISNRRNRQPDPPTGSGAGRPAPSGRPFDRAQDRPGVRALDRSSVVPIVSVVGNSGVGKTTFLEKLVRELKARGYRLATIKHDVHNFDIDRPGKDSWRLTQAGSDIVMLSSPRRLALMEEVEEERTLDQLAAMVEDRVELILTEGYRGAAALKIEVSRRAHSTSLTAPLEDLLAIVTDHPFDLDRPQFDLDAAAAVADLLEQRFALKRRPRM